MRAHTTELMHAGESSHCRVVFNDHMAGESRRIRHYDVISQRTVVADVRVCHQIIMISDSCVTAATLRTPMDVHVFAEHIVIADREKRLLASKFQILSLKTDRAERIKMVI